MAERYNLIDYVMQFFESSFHQYYGYMIYITTIMQARPIPPSIA